jgi:hypothetical protein
MRKSLQILALAAVLGGGPATVFPLFAAESHHSAGAMKGNGMMGGGDMKGMMNMMTQMNQMMRSCNKMMQSSTNGNHGPHHA